jgi:hypothetical protein
MGGGSGSTGGGSGMAGDCSSPAPLTFTDDTFESSGFLVGGSSTSMGCPSSAAGPDLAFSFSLSGPAYLFAMQGGNATSAPTLKLHSGSCSGTLISCAGSTSTNELVGWQTSALAAGTYVVVVDSQAGNGGNYTLAVSRSTTLGDTCTDARPITLAGTRALIAGSTEIFNHTLTSSCEESTTGSSTPDALFSFTAPRSGMLTLVATPETYNSFDINLSIRSGATCAASVEVPNGCNDIANAGEPEMLTLPVVQGTAYWIRVGGYGNSDKGAYTLELMLP